MFWKHYFVVVVVQHSKMVIALKKLVNKICCVYSHKIQSTIERVLVNVFSTHFINIHKHCGVSKRLWRGVKNCLSPSLFFYILTCCFDSLIIFISLSSLWHIWHILTECLLSLTLCDINNANIDLCSCFDFISLTAYSHFEWPSKSVVLVVLWYVHPSSRFDLFARSVRCWTWFESVNIESWPGRLFSISHFLHNYQVPAND